MHFVQQLQRDSCRSRRVTSGPVRRLLPSLPVHFLSGSLRGAVAFGVAAPSRTGLLSASREPARWPARLLPITRRRRGREPLPALGASRPLRHGTASPAPAQRGALGLRIRRPGGSRKRRAGRRPRAGLDHESAAKWISPKAPLKRGEVPPCEVAQLGRERIAKLAGRGHATSARPRR